MRALSKEDVQVLVERWDESDEDTRDDDLTDLLVKPYPTKASQDN